jgi:hypothetical protein
MEPYRYTSLPPGDPSTIRLVRLEPGQASDPLVCELFQVSLRNDFLPPYEALSYVWGDPKATSTLCCAGRDLTVTTNLETALFYLRDKDRSRILWIDAICINQQDLDERSRQVMLMRKIYQQAEDVIVWLGPELDGSKGAYYLIPQLAEVAFTDLPVEKPSTAKTLPLLLKRLGLPDMESPNWASLNSLYRRQWFRRIWVFQEVAVARHVTVVCGHEKMSWDVFARATHRYIASALRGSGLLHGPGMCELRGGWNAFQMNTWRQRIQDSHDAPLKELLPFARQFNCTDSRDRVYALLGLCDTPEVIHPDYNLSVSEIFQSCVKGVILCDSNLDVLAHEPVYDETRIQELASWCPDLRKMESWATWMNGGSYFPPFKAAGGSKPILDPSADPQCLVLQGICFDEIKITGDQNTYDSSGRNMMDLNIYERWLQLAAKNVRKPYPTGEVLLEAFWRTLVRNDLPEGPLPSRGHGNFVRNAAKFLDAVTSMMLPVEEESLDDDIRTRGKEWGHLCERLALARTGTDRIFLTEKGLIGTGPSELLPADAVCVLFGGRVPFVLRRVGDHYLFVGLCYVHGIMYGEALEDPNSSSREIVLR